MRTTVDLPDDVLRAAKIRAAERGETLREIFVRAVRRELALSGSTPGARVRLPLVGIGSNERYAVTADDIVAALEADDAERAIG